MSKADASIALLLFAGGCEVCESSSTEVTLHATGPGTAALHAVGSATQPGEDISAAWLGEAENHGPEPCRIGIYEHSTTPDEAAIPVLANADPAPEELADGGVLRFEAVLPEPRDGRVIVREIFPASAATVGLSAAYAGFLDPTSDGQHLESWLSIAACAGADVVVRLQVESYACSTGEFDGSFAVETWWPAN